jgi:hypothetical protein
MGNNRPLDEFQFLVSEETAEDLRDTGVIERFATESAAMGAGFKIAGALEAERAAFVVCAPANSPARDHFLPGYLRALCADCGTTIVHQPHAPTTPKKICSDCWTRRVIKAGMD